MNKDKSCRNFQFFGVCPIARLSAGNYIHLKRKGCCAGCLLVYCGHVLCFQVLLLLATPWENLFYAICERKRRKSGCASAQSDQRLRFRFLHSIMPIIVDIPEFSRLWLALVVEQAGLSPTWSESSEDRFSRDVAHTFTTLGAGCRLGYLIVGLPGDSFIVFPYHPTTGVHMTLLWSHTRDR